MHLEKGIKCELLKCSVLVYAYIICDDPIVHLLTGVLHLRYNKKETCLGVRVEDTKPERRIGVVLVVFICESIVVGCLCCSRSQWNAQCNSLACVDMSYRGALYSQANISFLFPDQIKVNSLSHKKLSHIMAHWLGAQM